MNLNTYFSYWAELYKEDMMNNIMPFWMKYGLDTQNGGIYTCVGRDGQLLDTTKSVWFQGRFCFYLLLCLQQHRTLSTMA